MRTVVEVLAGLQATRLRPRPAVHRPECVRTPVWGPNCLQAQLLCKQKWCVSANRRNTVACRPGSCTVRLKCECRARGSGSRRCRPPNRGTHLPCTGVFNHGTAPESPAAVHTAVIESNAGDDAIGTIQRVLAYPRPVSPRLSSHIDTGPDLECRSTTRALGASPTRCPRRRYCGR